MTNLKPVTVEEMAEMERESKGVQAGDEVYGRFTSERDPAWQAAVDQVADPDAVRTRPKADCPPDDLTVLHQKIDDLRTDLAAGLARGRAIDEAARIEASNNSRRHAIVLTMIGVGSLTAVCAQTTFASWTSSPGLAWVCGVGAIAGMISMLLMVLIAADNAR